jgi:hypothetical protein
VTAGKVAGCWVIGALEQAPGIIITGCQPSEQGHELAQRDLVEIDDLDIPGAIAPNSALSICRVPKKGARYR